MQKIQLKERTFGKYVGEPLDILEVPDQVAVAFSKLDMAIICGDEPGDTKTAEQTEDEVTEAKPKRKASRRKA